MTFGARPAFGNYIAIATFVPQDLRYLEILEKCKFCLNGYLFQISWALSFYLLKGSFNYVNGNLSNVTVSPFGHFSVNHHENWCRKVLETRDTGQRAGLALPKQKSSRSYAIECAAQ